MNLFNLAGMMGKLKEMQAEMDRTRKRLEDITVSGEAGGGLVRVTASGSRKLLKIEVDPLLVDPQDPETMCDLIIAAGNAALEAADKVSREEMQRVASQYMPNIPGLDLPGFGQ